MNSPIIFRTWDNVIDCAKIAAADMIAAGIQPSGVFGPPRGGCCLAVLFSHLLHIPYLSEPCEGCLIVDDVCDTGVTLEKYMDIPGVITYTDVAKESARVSPKFFGMWIPVRDTLANAWVEFPWEPEQVIV